MNEKKTDERVELNEVQFTFTQEPDSNDSGVVQTLKVRLEDAGGGHYFVIETERWAFDIDVGIAEFTALLRRAAEAIKDKGKS